MPELSLSHICLAYGEKPVLDDFTMDFPARGIFVLRAPSGRGKTSLLRVIAGLTSPDSGQVSGGGVTRCAFAFQEYRLFPWLDALDNLLCLFDRVTEAQRQAAADALRHFGFSEEDLGKYPDALSGGMKQRVSLCRALLDPRPILLLDEPTKELDAELRDLLYRRLREEGKRRLVLLSSHADADAPELGATVIAL